MNDTLNRPPVPDDIITISNRLAGALRARGWGCATAESCTGGGIALGITSVAGSSDYMHGGIVAYSNPIKQTLLNVRRSTLDSVGAVSEECAIEMARGVRQVLGTEVGISSTGIAGPGGATNRKPVGLVYIAVSTPETDEVRELRLSGDRQHVMRESARLALELANSTIGDGAPAPETEQ
ncbi:MAG: CinA family protein [Chloroflexota bacterium]|nr:CinA family protein [Chloroflexota bacterium]